MIDESRDGNLNAEELKRAFENMGERLTDAEVNDIIDEIDQDGNRTIDYNEFLLLVQSRIRDRELYKYSFEAFKLFT
jgi:calmodulin